MIHAIFDCSTNLASFAVYSNGFMLFEETAEGQRGASSLLPWLTELLEKEKLTVNDITHWTVGVGPGSFTGLRVGISFIKGICAGSNAQYRGVSSSYGLLTQVMSKEAIVIHDGRQQEILVHKFKLENGQWISDSIEVEAIAKFKAPKDTDMFTTMDSEKFDDNPKLQQQLFFIDQVKASGLAQVEAWPENTEEADKSCEPIYVRPAVFVEPIKKKDVSHLL